MVKQAILTFKNLYSWVMNFMLCLNCNLKINIKLNKQKALGKLIESSFS